MTENIQASSEDELDAMSAAYEALRVLDHMAAARALSWLAAKLNNMTPTRLGPY